MNARRDRAKKPLNRQPEPHPARTTGTWKNDLGKYLIDISKYIVTGVIIASLFQDASDKTVMYAVGAVFAVTMLISGLLLRNQTKEIETE